MTQAFTDPDVAGVWVYSLHWNRKLNWLSNNDKSSTDICIEEIRELMMCFGEYSTNLI